MSEVIMLQKMGNALGIIHAYSVSLSSRRSIPANCDIPWMYPISSRKTVQEVRILNRYWPWSESLRKTLRSGKVL